MATRALWLPWRRDRSTELKSAPQPAPAPTERAGEDAELRARREEIARMEERALREADSLGVRRASSTAAFKRSRTASETSPRRRRS